MTENNKNYFEKPVFKGHIEGLDTLRGFAIVNVLIYHFFMGWPFWTNNLSIISGHLLRIGWVGVDLFFVLSGFLITGILLDSRKSSYRWKNFMIRRIIRIFPLYYMIMTVIFVVLPIAVSFNVDTQHFSQMHSYWPWFYSYLSNIPLTFLHNRFPLSLSVTWSLAVEEQFYLFWPIVIFLPKRRYIIWIVIGAILISQFFKIWSSLYWPVYPGLTNYMVFGRIDQFGAGALAACLLRTPSLSARTWIYIRNSGFYFALPLALVMLLIKPWTPMVIFETVGRFLIAWATVGIILVILEQKNPFMNRFSKIKWLSKFGVYSYGIYLMHGFLVPWLALDGTYIREFTIDEFVRIVMNFFVFIVLVYIMALFSYTFFERPLLKLKRFFRNEN